MAVAHQSRQSQKPKYPPRKIISGRRQNIQKINKHTHNTHTQHPQTHPHTNNIITYYHIIILLKKPLKKEN